MKTEIDINKYLGKWFEIARIPSNFEPDLTNVTAEYLKNDNGTIKVINSGYNFGDRVSIEGVAKITDKDDVLLLSFFKDIETEYKILAITQDYSYALVGGSDPDYLWMLGRDEIMPTNIYKWFQEVALEHAYNVEKLKITKG